MCDSEHASHSTSFEVAPKLDGRSGLLAISPQTDTRIHGCMKFRGVMYVRQQVEALAQQNKDRVVLMPGHSWCYVPTLQSGVDCIDLALARVPLNQPDVATRIQASVIILVHQFHPLERKDACAGLGARFVRALTRGGEE